MTYGNATRRELLARGLVLGAAGALGRFAPSAFAAAPGAGALGSAAQARVDPAQFTSLAQLTDWQHALDDIGLRATGSTVHARYADGLADRLQRAGARNVTKEAVPLKRWEPSRWGLDVVGGAGAGPVPIAAYVPYSGSTPARGVTAPLSLAPAPGTIALVDVPPEPLPYAAFDALDWVQNQRDHDPTALYIRSWVSQGAVEDVLQRGGTGGALGAIFILDLPAEAAQGMYMPYHGIVYNMPSLFVDRDTGAKLREVAGGGGSVRLTLEASVTPVTTPNVYGFIPGASEDLVILHSHHDGTNGIEENGCEAMLAMTGYLGRLERCSLPRSVLVLMTTGHMAGNALGTETFIARHADDLLARTAAAVTVEHLGARSWLPGADGRFTLTGEYELGGFFAAPMDGVINRARASLDQAKVTENRVMRGFGTDQRSPDGTSWPGDGQGFWCIAGLPAANFITGPTYLLNGNMKVAEFIDMAAFRRQAIAFTDLVMDLTRVPLDELQRRRADDPVLHASATPKAHPARPAECDAPAGPPGAAPPIAVRTLGRRDTHGGLAVELRARGTVLRDVRVALLRSDRVVARARRARVTTHASRIVLRSSGSGRIAPGSYTLEVRGARTLLVRRTITVR